MINRRALIGATILLGVLLPAWMLVAPPLAERLVVAKPMDHADAILVLAGSSAYWERTGKAAALYHALVAPKVFLTNDGEKAGWASAEQQNPAFVELARRRLVDQGVPAGAIEILPRKVSGTIAEARLLAGIAAERRLKSLLIVTSSHHTRRALETFETVFAAHGMETRIGMVPAQDERETAASAFWWVTPTGWRDVAGEYVKSAYYDLAY